MPEGIPIPRRLAAPDGLRGTDPPATHASRPGSHGFLVPFHRRRTSRRVATAYRPARPGASGRRTVIRKRWVMIRTKWRMVGLAAALFVGWGCGGGAPPVDSSTAEATVQGTVTARGKPVTRGVITFDPSNIERPVGPRTAPIGKDGTHDQDADRQELGHRRGPDDLQGPGPGHEPDHGGRQVRGESSPDRAGPTAPSARAVGTGSGRGHGRWAACPTRSGPPRPPSARAAPLVCRGCLSGLLEEACLPGGSRRRGL